MRARGGKLETTVSTRISETMTKRNGRFFLEFFPNRPLPFSAVPMLINKILWEN